MVARRNYDDNYKSFRKSVLSRDKHKCQFPGCKKKTKLEIHHIIRWADNYEFRFEPKNGICLCKFHHAFIKNKEGIYISLFQEIVKRNESK